MMNRKTILTRDFLLTLWENVFRIKDNSVVVRCDRQRGYIFDVQKQTPLMFMSCHEELSVFSVYLTNNAIEGDGFTWDGSHL
jgi:hypothetical protein